MSNLILDGRTATPLSYKGITKFEHEWLKNVKYLNGLKTAIANTEDTISKKENIKHRLLKLFKLNTIQGVSAIKYNDLQTYFLQTFNTKVRNHNELKCYDTRKQMLVFDIATKTKYVSFSWLLEVLSGHNANNYFLKRAIQQLTT